MCVPVCSQTGKEEPHVFKEKTFRKRRQCGVCHQSVDSTGSFCRGESLPLSPTLSLLLSLSLPLSPPSSMEDPVQLALLSALASCLSQSQHPPDCKLIIV